MVAEVAEVTSWMKIWHVTLRQKTELKNFYVGLYIFRLFYIWMPLSVSIITIEPLNLEFHLLAVF